MKQPEAHLDRLAAYAQTIIHGEAVEQFGAICFRKDPGGSVEVLLITTRETNRWSIPKGWPIKGLKAHEVVEREAWEEAGIKGKVKKRPWGYFSYLKTLADKTTVPAVVEVHLLEVTKTSAKFPECKERVLEWLSPTEAAVRVSEPELKGLLTGLMNRAAV